MISLSIGTEVSGPVGMVGAFNFLGSGLVDGAFEIIPIPKYPPAETGWS